MSNIDDFMSKVRYIKEIEQTFEGKKDLSQNLNEIYYIMQVNKFDVKKRKDFETVTLKLKDQLEQEMHNFEQSFERQAQYYARDVNKIYLPKLNTDTKNLSEAVSNPKFLNFGIIRDPKDKLAASNSIIGEIRELKNKYEDLQERNNKCTEYQSTLSLYSEGAEQPVQQKPKETEQ